MSIEDLIHIHHEQGRDLMNRNLGKQNKSRDELLLATRHFLCAWVLDEATSDQVLDIVDKNKRSPFN
jgi:hypothetical protein